MMPLVWLGTPLGKIAAGVVAASLLTSVYFGWREYQRAVGEAQEVARVNAGLLRQEQESKGQMILLSALAQRHAAAHTQSEQQRRRERGRLQKEIDQYATATHDAPTMLSPDFARVFDSLNGVRRPTLSDERLSASGENAPGAALLPGRGDGGIADTAVLRAHEECHAQKRKYREGWERLTAFDDDRYAREWTFYTQHHEEQHRAAGVE
jgi:hypothetical protein